MRRCSWCLLAAIVLSTGVAAAKPAPRPAARDHWYRSEGKETTWLRFRAKGDQLRALFVTEVRGKREQVTATVRRRGTDFWVDMGFGPMFGRFWHKNNRGGYGGAGQVGAECFSLSRGPNPDPAPNRFTRAKAPPFAASLK